MAWEKVGKMKHTRGWHGVSVVKIADVTDYGDCWESWLQLQEEERMRTNEIMRRDEKKRIREEVMKEIRKDEKKKKTNRIGKSSMNQKIKQLVKKINNILGKNE